MGLVVKWKKVKMSGIVTSIRTLICGCELERLIFGAQIAASYAKSEGSQLENSFRSPDCKKFKTLYMLCSNPGKCSLRRVSKMTIRHQGQFKTDLTLVSGLERCLQLLLEGSF